MAQSVINKAIGLRSFKNELTLPEGSLITADNVVIDRDNVIEPRRGYKLYGDFGIAADRAKQLLQYKNTALLHYSDKLLYDNGSGTLAAFYGSFSELSSGLRIKGIETSGNFYFTTDNGIKKISATSVGDFTTASNYIIDAGVGKALNGVGTANIGTPGFLTIGDTHSVCAVAYRTLWGYKDANEVLVLGAPSEYFIVRNLDTVSTAVVDLTFTIPEEINGDSRFFYQVYRSAVVNDSTTPGTAVPSDELNLVFEDFPTSGDFTNGYVEIQDITPNDFRSSGAPLYTNAISGDGILQANDRPPLAQDITVYQNFTFYANTKTRHQKSLDIISTALLNNDDTLIIGDSVDGDVTYTFKATENIASKHVYLATGGSVSQNIDDTARSLVRVINRNTASVYAYYLSGAEDIPGQIYLEARDLEDVEFYCKVDVGVDTKVFNPSLPTDDSETSSNTESPNRIYYSKQRQPESVPSINYFDVGEKDQPIRRIVALRDSLFILKGDGIFRLSGNDPSNFVVTLSDSSATITAPDSVAVLNNQIFMLTSQGVVSIPESGSPVVVSRDIEDLILKPTSSQYTNFSTATFGVAYESDRAYLLFLPTDTSDTQATQCYRYNVFTRSWTRFFDTQPKLCGIVLKGQDMLYLGAGDTNYIEKERKTFDRTDNADRQYDNSFPSDPVVSDYVIELSTLNDVVVGDSVYQEMYISISRFNRLLRKLDTDFLLDDTNYESLLVSSAGASMTNSLANLVTKLNIDDSTTTYTAPSGSNVIATIRDEFNTLMDELNASAGVFYGNYTKYTDSIAYESVITSIDTTNNAVTVIDVIPFIEGANVIYQAIISEIEWAANSLGDPSVQKHFREASVMFDQYNFTIAEVEFRTDIADAYEGIAFQGEGNGAYGSQVYGEYVFGGLANQRPFRTYVPRNKQRCRFIYIKFTHKGSREKYAVTGYSVTYKQYASERAYKN